MLLAVEIKQMGPEFTGETVSDDSIRVNHSGVRKGDSNEAPV